MASAQVPQQGADLDPSKDPIKYWRFRYTSGNTQWHLDLVSPLLVDHYTKLNPDGRAKRVLYPMCGMSVDLDWFADEKGLEVVGVDIAVEAIQKVVARSSHEWTESPAPKLGPDARMFRRNDGKVKLYCGDMLRFNLEVEGKFDAVCDRDGLHVVEPEKRQKYAEMIKEILNPQGRLLVEAIYYDPKILEEKDFPMVMRVPPPYSLKPEDMKALFEPDCSVEHIDRNTYKLLYGKDTDFNAYLIIKQ